MSSQPLLQTAADKRVALPTRVEPKVFFANERTYLTWLNMSIVLGSLSIAMLNFGDNVAFYSSGVYIVLAVGIAAYALFTFHWRAQSIRRRGQAGFDDRVGPYAVTFALVAAVLTNFILRLTHPTKP